MISTTFLSLVSALLLLVAAASSLKRGGGPEKQLFLLAASIMAASEICIFLFQLAHDPTTALARARCTLSALVFFPAIGFPLFSIFARRDAASMLARRMPILVCLAVTLAAFAAVMPVRLFIAKLHFANNLLWGMTLSGAGKALVGYFLVINVMFMHIFENLYRSASVADKVTLKYPLLGMAISTIINVVIASKALAIAQFEKDLLVVHSCGVIFLSMCVTYASIRYPLFSLKVSPATAGKTSIVSVAIAGLYLLALSIMALWARILDLPYDKFTSMIIGLFIVFSLTAILISGKARRRLRTIVSENLLSQKYNYRKEWRRYAEIMEASSFVEDFLSNVISSLCDTMTVKKGIFWADFGPGKAGWYGFEREAIDRNLIDHLLRLTENEPILILPGQLERPPSARAEEDWSWVRAVARIGTGNETRGLIALGEMHFGRSYTDEDRDFLSLIAYRAKITLDAMIMEEHVIEERQMESFNRVASFIIHDLKNTLSMLSLTAENARISMGKPEFQSVALETIQRSIERMQGLINSLTARKIPSTINRSNTDVSMLSLQALDAMKLAASKKKLSLESRIEQGLQAYLDPEAIKRVIENLLLNAIEATPTEGRVSLTVAKDERNWLKIEVSDTGPGFDQEYLARHLFHPFHSTKKDGLGIGLILCKTLAEAHGGKITIDNSRPRGASVIVHLPMTSATGE